MSDEQTISDLQLENEQLRITLNDLVGNVLEDVPTESMTEHLAQALFDAQELLTDLSDVDHKETEE